MANDQDRNQNPATGAESDISKSQSQQQPQGQAGQRTETGEEAAGQFEDTRKGQQEFGQDRGEAPTDEAQQGETATTQRTDVEGASAGTPESGEAESGFVGSQGGTDTSSELVEDEDEDFEKDGQGAPDAE